MNFMLLCCLRLGATSLPFINFPEDKSEEALQKSEEGYVRIKHTPSSQHPNYKVFGGKIQQAFREDRVEK